MSKVKLDMAGRPLPDRTYPAETGSTGYTLSERTLGQWLEYWAETTPDKEYIVYSDRDLRFTWSKFNERVDNLAKGVMDAVKGVLWKDDSLIVTMHIKKFYTAGQERAEMYVKGIGE